MKPIYTLIIGLFLFNLNSKAQITFWTEDFGFFCGTGTEANNYFGFSGPWTVTNTGTNGSSANVWYVSAEENGNLAGECGTACGDDRSLHMGSTFVGDAGALYYESGFPGICDLFGCGDTDKRANSPIINCAGFTTITLEFVYLEGGNASDNATLWYFDGTTWSQLADLPKTPLVCAPQGQWTTYSIVLPASANNNPDVKIGFRWVNVEDGAATDPSFAVDDMSLTGDFGEDINPPTIECPSEALSEIVFEDFCTAFVADYTNDAFVTDDTDPFPVVEQTPEPGDIVTGPTLVTITATDIAGNSSSCSFMLDVTDVEAPIITCPENLSTTSLPGNDLTEMFIPVPEIQDCSAIVDSYNDFNNTMNSSGFYPLGVTTVTYYAEDSYGNSSTCSFTVEIIENINQNCCLGDFNCDGVVSVLDLILLVSQFGCNNNCTTDLDNDGVVGVTDMQIFTGLYGNICPE